MRILLTGRIGQVGWELERTLAPLGEVIATDRETLDLSDADAIRRVVREVKPEVIVNAAAYTAVDRAESEPEAAMRVNGVAPGVLAEEAKRLDALLVHYSTDYVFDGTKATPYTEDDIPNPRSVYGESKLAGENAVRAAGGRHLIVRTGWVYGPRGNNFLLTILRLAREREELRIVSDQRAAPTSAVALARATLDVLRRHGVGATGLFHLTAGGETSWFGFAEAIVTRAGLPRASRVVPIPSTEYPVPARRPAYSVLDCAKASRALGVRLADWQVGLDEVWRRLPSS